MNGFVTESMRRIVTAHGIINSNNYTKTYDNNSYIRNIFDELKKNTWIFDYYKKSDDEGYVVVKNPTKDKRH